MANKQRKSVDIKETFPIFNLTHPVLVSIALIVDGKWTLWEAWSICSLTCGGGVQDRSRTCTNPPPAFGGALCTGPSKSTRLCNEHPCPGDDTIYVSLHILPAR